MFGESDCLRAMIPPSRIRPGKMGGGGVMQILLTRACSLSCYHCTQGSNLGGKPSFMSLEHFSTALDSLEGYPWLIALFGGQPTLHPLFPEICEILRARVPIEHRGLWTNALHGHGAICRQTFLPHNCNLNVHLSQEAFDEFTRDWPEARPFGLTKDSRHSPPFVAMQDIGIPETERWQLISRCPINRNWSSLIGTFRGQLRGWFCEIAGAQAMLHEHEEDYPDTGIPIYPSSSSPTVTKWWQRSMEGYADQVRYHCHRCGIPLNSYGRLAVKDEGKAEQVSASHEAIYISKRRRPLELVTDRHQLQEQILPAATDYLGNSNL